MHAAGTAKKAKGRAAGGGGVIAVDHLLSDGRGSQPVPVTVCRTCEAADPDFNRLRSAGGLPFYYGIHRGRAGAGR